MAKSAKVDGGVIGVMIKRSKDHLFLKIQTYL